MSESAQDSHLEENEGQPTSPIVESEGETAEDVSLPTWRLVTIFICLFLSLFLCSIEGSIVATALVNIASSISGYDRSNWIVNSYMLTYMGFLPVHARLSDILGRKAILLTALCIFGTFSLACSFAQTMKQLIHFRALQGLGASGIYALIFPVSVELASMKRVGVILGSIAAVYTSASVLGPTLGGAISNNGKWRWVFLLNVPVILPVLVVFTFLLPPMKPRSARGWGCAVWGTVDWPGMLLVLGASVSTVFALQSAGTMHAWDSAVILGTLTGGLFSFLLLAAWEVLLHYIQCSSTNRRLLPIFPAGLFRQRIPPAAMITSFLTGFPFLTTLVLLPQRLQITNDLSTLSAGQRFITLLLPSALGSISGGAVRQKPIYPWILIVAANGLQVLGMGLMSTLDTGIEVQWQTYPYMVILGVGFGCGLGGLNILARMKVKPQDSAILMALLTQLRILGGCIGVAIATSLMLSYVAQHLAGKLTSSEISGILASPVESIGALSLDKQALVRKVCGEAWALQQKVMLGVSGAGFLAGLFMFTNEGMSPEEVGVELREWERNGRQIA